MVWESLFSLQWVKCENKHQKSESCYSCLAQCDKTISEVKLTAKFYSLQTSFRVEARVD